MTAVTEVAGLRKEMQALIEHNTKLTRDLQRYVGRPNMFLAELNKYYKALDRDRVIAAIENPSDKEAIQDLLNAVDYYITTYPT
jgi:hypothetical protein